MQEFNQQNIPQSPEQTSTPTVPFKFPNTLTENTIMSYEHQDKNDLHHYGNVTPHRRTASMHSSPIKSATLHRQNGNSYTEPYWKTKNLDEFKFLDDHQAITGCEKRYTLGQHNDFTKKVRASMSNTSDGTVDGSMGYERGSSRGRSPLICEKESMNDENKVYSSSPQDSIPSYDRLKFRRSSNVSVASYHSICTSHCPSSSSAAYSTRGSSPVFSKLPHSHLNSLSPVSLLAGQECEKQETYQFPRNDLDKLYQTFVSLQVENSESNIFPDFPSPAEEGSDELTKVIRDDDRRKNIELKHNSIPTISIVTPPVEFEEYNGIHGITSSEKSFGDDEEIIHEQEDYFADHEYPPFKEDKLDYNRVSSSSFTPSPSPTTLHDYFQALPTTVSVPDKDALVTEENSPMETDVLSPWDLLEKKETFPPLSKFNVNHSALPYAGHWSRKRTRALDIAVDDIPGIKSC